MKVQKELDILYPLLQLKGVLMVDDYAIGKELRKQLMNISEKLNQVVSQCNGFSTIPAGDI